MIDKSYGKNVVNSLGNITGIIFGVLFLLWLVSIISNFYITGCEEGALSYYNCKIGSVDVTYWVNMSSWFVIKLFMIANGIGLLWLISKVLIYPSSKDSKFIKMWLLLLLFIVITVILLSKLLLGLV